MVFVTVLFIIVRSIPEIERDEISINITFYNNNTVNKVIQFSDLTSIGMAFEIIELIIFAWFIFEYLIRLIFSPNKKNFLTSLSNIVDLFVILFYITYLFIKYNTIYFQLSNLMRTIRIIILMKITRFSHGLKIFGKTIIESYKEIFVLLIFLGVASVFFGSIVQYNESFSTGDYWIKNFQESFWQEFF